MIVGLSGYARSGKDTAAEALIDSLGFQKVAFADKLRACMSALNPIVDITWNTDIPGNDYDDFIRYNDAINLYGYDKSKEKFNEFRALLQRMGTEVGRNVLGENIWVESVMRDLDPNKSYVFTDMRFLNEFNAVKEAGGITVRIIRDGVGPLNNHPSEISLDGEQFDVVISNDTSIEDFKVRVISCLEAGRV